jgi:hypothetical protein
MAGFAQLHQQAVADGALSKKVKELLAVRTQAVAAKRALSLGKLYAAPNQYYILGDGHPDVGTGH